MDTLPMWEYAEYSPYSKQLAKTCTLKELHKMLVKLENEADKYAYSHLNSIIKTSSMQSCSQRRAHSRNNLQVNYTDTRATKNAIEIYKYYFWQTKEFQMIFDYIKAAKFFPNYCQQVKNWKHKLRGKNGRGNPVEFSKEDISYIKKSWKKASKDISESLNNFK